MSQMIYYKIDLIISYLHTTMTEPSNTKHNSSQLQSDEPKNPQKDTVIEANTINQAQCHPLFRHYEKNLVLFAYKREADEEPPHQIMILQQSRKRYNKATEVDKVAQMFGNFNLEGTTQKLFLTKVDPLQHKQITKQIKEMLGVADSLSRKDRLQRRKQMFESTRPHKMDNQFASQQVLAKRKIRVVKMDSLIQGGSIKGVVELGGKSIEYEDLNIMNQNQDYYTLVRRKVKSDQVFPQVSIQENLLNAIDFEEQNIEEEKNINNQDDFDSNDSDNSAFEYPDEEESDRSSEGIIRDYDSEDRFSEQDKEDDEELYLRYLRRERRREQQMELEGEVRYEEYD